VGSWSSWNWPKAASDDEVEEEEEEEVVVAAYREDSALVPEPASARRGKN
jgi:hypothetical protein